MRRHLLGFLTVILAALPLLARTENVTRKAIFTRKPPLSAAAIALDANAARMRLHCFAGCPNLDRDKFDFGRTQIVARGGYVLEESLGDKIPLWVSEFVTKAQISGNKKRSNKFLPDPLLPKGERAELVDYRGSGFDRGHQAPAGNQTTDAKLKDETFFLSNMAPQVPSLNQQLWKEIEDMTRDWVELRGEAFEVTGGFFYDPEEEDPATADGAVEFEQIGPNKVAVPTHFYKIIIAKKPGTNQMEALAFVAENVEQERPFDFESLLQSIDWIEERTGIDFFPELSAAEEARLERNAATTLWPTQ